MGHQRTPAGQTMIEAFLAKALIAGVIVAIVSGVMGCFVVWRRMAYFGDSLAHSALLGIAMGVL
jgi:zinc transport system permease protein